MEQVEQAGAGASDSPSLTDRIADVLSGPEPQVEDAASSEAPVEGAPETAPEFAEVEYEGEKFQVPAKLKEAIIHKDDYTRKTQEVATQRRNIEVQEDALRIAGQERQFHQSIAGEVQDMHLIDARIKQLQQIDWSSLSTDELMRSQVAVQQLREQRSQIEQAMQGKRQQFEQAQRQGLETLKTKALDALKKSIPQWSDGLAKQIAEHAISDGYSQGEVNTIIDPRQINTLYKAMQYDKLVANKASAVGTVQNAPTIRPTSSKPMSQEVKAKLNYRNALKSAPSTQAKQRVIEGRIGQIFGGR